MPIGFFRATAIAGKLARALVGKEGDEAEWALREQLREIKADLSDEEIPKVARLIHVAAEELG